MSQDNKEVKFIAASLRNLDRLAATFEQLLPIITTLAMSHEIDQERQVYLLESLDDIKNDLGQIKRAILVQGANQDKPEIRSITAELREEMFDGLLESLKARIKIKTTERLKLLEDSARQGDSVEFRITQRLIVVNEEIEKLKCELESLRGLQDD